MDNSQTANEDADDDDVNDAANAEVAVVAVLAACCKVSGAANVCA